MNNTWRIPLIVIALLTSLFFSGYLFAADFDELYGCLVENGNLLYEVGLDYFRLIEEGDHGSAAYNKFDAAPFLYTIRNHFRFTPITDLELALGFNSTLPNHYKRSTFTTAGSLGVVQRFAIDYFYDYIFSLRKRFQPVELFLDILERKQKDNWNSATYPSAPNYFSYIYSHFEDFTLGCRFLTESDIQAEKSNLSLLKHPLLDYGQVNIETELEYHSGKLRRSTNYYFGNNLYILDFFHNLKPHYIPRLNLRYGLKNNLELNTGLACVTPHKYIYEYRENRPAGKTLLIIGNYKLNNDFRVPFKITFRPENNLEISLSSDSRFATQKLNYWKKADDNTLTIYPAKKIKYYNTQPALKISYLYNNNKPIKKDDFLNLSADLLRRNQALVEVQYQKDLTHLSKNISNGPLNLIDQYNAFLYPLDYFVIGSEYAALLTGNTSRFVTNINPQNYYQWQVSLGYGLFDNFNINLSAGYHSSCSLHHFTLYDIVSRFYKFKPYYFFNLGWKWRMKENVMLVFDSRFVPEYKTVLHISTDPEPHLSRNKYISLSTSIKILF